MEHHYDIIFYHKNCPDGIGSLWAANYKKRIPIHYPLPAGENPTKIDIEEKSILFVDICPNDYFILENIGKVKKMTILDHHKSSREMVEDIMKKKIPNLEIIFDMERSGATITWDYFFPNTPYPFFIHYIEDKDLWRYKLPHSQEINFALESYLTIEKLTSLLENEEEWFQKLLEDGKVKKEENDKKIKKNADSSIPDNFIFQGNVYQVRKVYNISNKNLISDVGNYLCEQYPEIDFAIVISSYSSYSSYSLRGIKGKCPDLSLIAKEYGGGGHPSSAGIRVYHREEKCCPFLEENYRNDLSLKFSRVNMDSCPILSQQNTFMKHGKTPANSPILKK